MLMIKINLIIFHTVWIYCSHMLQFSVHSSFLEICVSSHGMEKTKVLHLKHMSS